MMGDPQRIGVYGGGFDPVHNGHLRLAHTALDILRLDRLLFVPAAGVAHYKSESNVAAGEHRVAMLRLAFGDETRFEVCEHELRQGRFCYTIETLRSIRDQAPPDSEIILLTGGDWKNKLHTWKDGDVLLREFTVALFSRPGFENETNLTPETPERRMIYVHMPPVEASSSDIRRRLREGLPVGGLLPDAVGDYIVNNKLYNAQR